MSYKYIRPWNIYIYIYGTPIYRRYATLSLVLVESMVICMVAWCRGILHGSFGDVLDDLGWLGIVGICWDRSWRYMAYLCNFHQMSIEFSQCICFVAMFVVAVVLSLRVQSYKVYYIAESKREFWQNYQKSYLDKLCDTLIISYIIITIKLW